MNDVSKNPYRDLKNAHIEDMKLFNKLYLPCHRKLTSFCLSKLKDVNLAKDAATETLIKLLYDKREEEIHNIEAWVFTVAKSICYAHLTKVKRRRNIWESVSHLFKKEEAPKGENSMIAKSLDNVIKTTLSERDYHIWNLHQEGYNNEEIAKQLKIAEKTIANRKTIIRNKLRIELKKL